MSENLWNIKYLMFQLTFRFIMLNVVGIEFLAVHKFVDTFYRHAGLEIEWVESKEVKEFNLNFSCSY